MYLTKQKEKIILFYFKSNVVGVGLIESFIQR